MSHKKVLPTYFHIKTISKSLAVCNITGISIQFDMPFIPGKGYEYDNPLAYRSNARTLANESYSIVHANMSQPLLAGMFLSLLTNYELIEDHLSAVERNILLCEIPPYHLSSFSRYLASLSQKQIDKLPHISLDSDILKESTVFNSVKNYIEQCKESLEYKEEQRNIVYSTKTKKIIRHTNFTVEIRRQARELLKTLINDRILPIRIVHILKVACQKENLVTMSPTLRTTLTTALGKFEHPNAIKLASILTDIEKNKTVQETILMQQLDNIDGDMSYHSDSQIPSTKLTLKEILDRKIHPEKYMEKQESKYSTQEIIDEIFSVNDEIDQENAIDNEFSIEESEVEELDFSDDSSIEQTSRSEGEDDEF